MDKEKSVKAQDAYVVFWTDGEGNDRWEVPTMNDPEQSGFFPGAKKYIYDMHDVNAWILEHLGNVGGQIGVAKIRKVVKVKLNELKE